jgi:hypothetical protein
MTATTATPTSSCLMLNCKRRRGLRTPGSVEVGVILESSNALARPPVLEPSRCPPERPADGGSRFYPKRHRGPREEPQAWNGQGQVRRLLWFRDAETPEQRGGIRTCPSNRPSLFPASPGCPRKKALAKTQRRQEGKKRDTRGPSTIAFPQPFSSIPWRLCVLARAFFPVAMRTTAAVLSKKATGGQQEQTATRR